MSTFKLPEGIIYEILLRLPVKSVIRFKSVCRRWYVLIKSPLFTRNHLKSLRNVNSDRAFSSIIAFTRKKEVLRFYSSESLEKPDNIALPMIYNFDKYQVFGICDGLVCLSVSYYSFVIFNPIIAEFRIIPRSTTPDGYRDRVFLGFRSCDNSYELTCIVYYSTPNMGVAVRGEVYSLVTNSWRQINVNMESPVELTVHCYGVNPISLRGKFYWGCSDSTQDRVVCFDTSRQNFSEIMPPTPLTMPIVGWKVQNWKEELALAIYLIPSEFSVWVFSENELKWTKNLTINQFPESFLEHRSHEITVMGCGRNGELILRCEYWRGNELLLYDPSSKEMKPLPYVDATGNEELYLFTESLVSLHQN